MPPRVVRAGMEIENHVYIFSRQAWKKLSTDRQFEIYKDLLEQYSILLKGIGEEKVATAAAAKEGAKMPERHSGSVLSPISVY